MRRSPRLFPDRLTPRQRTAYRATTFFFIALFFASIWPIYPLFAGIRPRVLGVPFSLAYVIGLVLLSFTVLVALFRWEERQGTEDSDSQEQE